MASPRPDDRIEWLPLTTVYSTAEARELLALLTDAKVRTRIEAAGDGGPWTIEVPGAEVPVASGVAEHFLRWFRAPPEGDADDSEVLAALDEPVEPEFAERVERERSSHSHRNHSSALVAIIALAVGLGLMLWYIATLLLR